MPAGLPPTPWLQGADPAQHFMQAYQTGAQISEANARMQQQASQTQMELEMRQREHQQQSLMEQQRMEIEKQYHQSQVAMQQQKLQEAKRMNDQKLQQFAAVASAKQQYQQKMDSATTDEQRAAIVREFGPLMFPSGAGAGAMMGAANKMSPPQAPLPQWMPPNPATGQPGAFAGHATVPASEGKLDPNTALQGRALESAYAKAIEDLSVAKQSKNKLLIQKNQATVDDLKSQLEQLGKPAQASAPTKSSHEVVRVTKDGKKAVFDSETKKFLRYAD